jgi:Probable transposase
VCEPHGECGDPEAGLDWGVETFATLAYGPGEYDAFVNDRLLNTEQEALRIERRQSSHALRAKRSRRALEARRTLAKPHRKVANRRKYHIHQVGQAGSPAWSDRDRLKRGDPRYGHRVVCHRPVRQSGRGWMQGDLVGHSTASVVADVPEPRACSQKIPVRTRASMWLRIRGGAGSSRRAFDARRWA